VRDDKSGIVWAIACATLLAVDQPAAAQAVTAGVKAGVVAARLNTDGAGAFDTSADAGATAGGFVAFEAGRRLRVQAEVLYAERRFSSAGLPIAFTVRSRGVEVPLLVQLIAASPRRVRPMVYAGPYLSAVSRVRQRSAGQWVDISDRIVDVDAGVTAGGGVEVSAGRGAVVVEARASIGLRELNEAPPPEFRSRAFGLLLGYRF
jgi:hypothetical protein